MPYKIIPFPCEIKITLSDFGYAMVFTILIKVETVEACYLIFLFL